MASRFTEIEPLNAPLRNRDRSSIGSGQIGLLPAALDHRSYAQMLLGRYRDAAANCTEGLKIADDIGQGHAAASLRTNLAWIAAIQGDEGQCRTMAEVGIEATAGHRSPTSGLNGT